jgi:small-conductance mechanosensitive channel
VSSWFVLWARLVGPERSLEMFGIKLVGVNYENGKKLLMSLALIAIVLAISWALRAVMNSSITRHGKRIAFWTRHLVRLLLALVMVVGITSIWFTDAGRLGTFIGLVSAGVAFAMQRVITAFFGYLTILRGNVFNVGDRIKMSSVHGDVIALGFLRTSIMEMGQPPGEQGDAPSMWVEARQYTGRVVTVTNDKIFDEPIYNYSSEFPYIWEEMRLPIRYQDDRARVEQILLDVARRHTLKISEVGENDLKEMERRYAMRRSDLGPRVYWRMTDNWIELTVRFLSRDSGIRDLKDAMTRDILNQLDEAKIGIASGTYAIVELPTVKIERAPGPTRGERRQDASSGGEWSKSPESAPNVSARRDVSHS